MKVGFALTPRQFALLDVHQNQFETSSHSASLRTILDEYIASVPAFADVLDQIVIDQGPPLSSRRPAR